jgi:hypothetical protein
MVVAVAVENCEDRVVKGKIRVGSTAQLFPQNLGPTVHTHLLLVCS